MVARRSAAIAAVALCILWTAGCATPGPTVPPDPNAPVTTTQRTGPTIGQRASSALEGALMGAVIGGQMGPIGAAVGAASAMIYSAITGQVPFSAGPSWGSGPLPTERDRENALEDEIEREMARQASLETEIEDELSRQEGLLEQIERDDALDSPPAPVDPVASLPPEESEPTETDPRAAPAEPKDRALPEIVFEQEEIVVPKDTWGNDRDMPVVKRTLDADRDGVPEQVRYVDPRTGRMVHKEQDRDYDGRIDAWQNYSGDSVAARQLDENDDGRPDVWEEYEGGRMTSRQVDRDQDGNRDAFYDYEGGSLVEERHDTNGDGRTDLVVTYRDRVRARSEEDTSKDGHMDTWTTYQVVGDAEVISRVERDKTASGSPNVFEIYEPNEGKPQLVRREEDVNGDGDIDIISVYENGRLVRREVSDPALMPL